MSNSNDNDNLVLEEACRVVDRAYRRIRVDRQYRRLRTALRKLGITQIVGDATNKCAPHDHAVRDRGDGAHMIWGCSGSGFIRSTTGTG